MKAEDIKDEIESLQRKDRLDPSDVAKLKDLSSELKRKWVNPAEIPGSQNSVVYEFAKAVKNLPYPATIGGWQRQKEWCRIRREVINLLEKEEGENG